MRGKNVHLYHRYVVKEKQMGIMRKQGFVTQMLSTTAIIILLTKTN
jgi:hypothetical protein